ncbi:hypothetical protein VP01_2181g1 [Puccinia sorghi]|uniref:Uncharacterized protein n=1 Tax=Puccinia sorghi TaxID=27349 RepID=A0A0L6V9I0_9BASI|nr:hypothetical protein VP01_2181g1 [Puccinia sorghi]
MRNNVCLSMVHLTVIYSQVKLPTKTLDKWQLQGKTFAVNHKPTNFGLPPRIIRVFFNSNEGTIGNGPLQNSQIGSGMKFFFRYLLSNLYKINRNIRAMLFSFSASDSGGGGGNIMLSQNSRCIVAFGSSAQVSPAAWSTFFIHSKNQFLGACRGNRQVNHVAFRWRDISFKPLYRLMWQFVEILIRLQFFFFLFCFFLIISMAGKYIRHLRSSRIYGTMARKIFYDSNHHFDFWLQPPSSMSAVLVALFECLCCPAAGGTLSRVEMFCCICHTAVADSPIPSRWSHWVFHYWLQLLPKQQQNKIKKLIQPIAALDNLSSFHPPGTLGSILILILHSPRNRISCFLPPLESPLVATGQNHLAPSKTPSGQSTLRQSEEGKKHHSPLCSKNNSQNIIFMPASISKDCSRRSLQIHLLSDHPFCHTLRKKITASLTPISHHHLNSLGHHFTIRSPTTDTTTPPYHLFVPINPQLASSLPPGEQSISPSLSTNINERLLCICPSLLHLPSASPSSLLLGRPSPSHHHFSTPLAKHHLWIASPSHPGVPLSGNYFLQILGITQRQSNFFLTASLGVSSLLSRHTMHTLMVTNPRNSLSALL